MSVVEENMGECSSTGSRDIRTGMGEVEEARANGSRHELGVYPTAVCILCVIASMLFLVINDCVTKGS